jgi:four helix bundle protein
MTVNEQRKGQDICDRTFAFGVEIVRLCRYLNERTTVGRVLVNQLLKSGTSIGANVEEAQAGQSGPDFISKYGIALKEARETHYWLRLLVAAECVVPDLVYDKVSEADEIKRVIGAIIVSARKRQG